MYPEKGIYPHRTFGRYRHYLRPDGGLDAEAGTGNLHRRVARERHRTGCNVLFADWHVEWMGAEEMTLNMWRFRDQ